MRVSSMCISYTSDCIHIFESLCMNPITLGWFASSHTLMYILRRSSRCSFTSCVVIPRNNVKSLKSSTLDTTKSIVPSANGSNFFFSTRCVIISSIILDFSSVHKNPPELEASIGLCCNINKGVKFRIYNSIFNYSKNYTYLQGFAASLLLTPLFFFWIFGGFFGLKWGEKGASRLI